MGSLPAEHVTMSRNKAVSHEVMRASVVGYIIS